MEISRVFIIFSRTGIGVEFNHDHISGIWRVKEVLEHLCLVSEADSEQTTTIATAAIATSKHLSPGDELVAVITFPSASTMHVFGNV